MSNVVALDSFRKRKDPLTVMVGDSIEWVDYTGERIISKVLDIETIDLNQTVDLGTTTWGNAKEADLKYKNLYSFKLADGMTLFGEAVVRKIV